MEVDHAEGNGGEEDESWMEPEEGDEVVKELDVCVSTRLASNLQVFQFPLRPRSRQYENDQSLGGIRVRCKPKVGFQTIIIFFCSGPCSSTVASFPPPTLSLIFAVEAL